MKKKTCLSFIVSRKLSNGYRIIKLDDGREYDFIGIEVETKQGDIIPICLEVLPNGLHNFYVPSDNYIIDQPKNFRLIGKLTKIQPKEKSK